MIISMLILIIYWMMFGEVILGFFFISYRYNKNRNISFIYALVGNISALLAIISRILLFHKNSLWRNIGIQWSSFFIISVISSLYLFILSLEKETQSPFDIALIFIILGSMFSLSFLNLWDEKEITSGFYTFIPSNSMMLLVIGGTALYLVYLEIKLLLSLKRFPNAIPKNNPLFYFKLFMISLMILMPSALLLQGLASSNIIGDMIMLSINSLVSSVLVFIIFGLIFLGITLLGGSGIPFSHYIYGLLIVNLNAEIICQYHFQNDIPKFNESEIATTLTYFSRFYQKSLHKDSDSTIREIRFGNLFFLSRFKGFYSSIPSYSIILITKKKSLFIRTALDKLSHIIENFSKIELQELVLQKKIPTKLDNVIKTVFEAPHLNRI